MAASLELRCSCSGSSSLFVASSKYNAIGWPGYSAFVPGCRSQCSEQVADAVCGGPQNAPSSERGRCSNGTMMPTVATPSTNGIARAAQLTPAIVSASSTARSTPAASTRSRVSRGHPVPGGELERQAPGAIEDIQAEDRGGRGCHAQQHMGRRRGGELDQLAAARRCAAVPSACMRAPAEDQQARCETVVHACLFDGPYGRQLAQQPVHGGAWQAGFLRKVGDPRAPQRTQELQQPKCADSITPGPASSRPFRLAAMRFSSVRNLHRRLLSPR